MKRIICFLMSILIIITCAPISLAAGGDGSEANPYLITNAQELTNINNDLDAHYKLAGNINLTNINFEPIGNADNGAFTGSFDGNGFTILGLSIYGKPKYSGLFGFCNGEVKNLTLADVHIEGGRFSGGIVGFLDADGVIRNCTVSGYVNAETSVSYSAAGGIAGYCAGEITDCANKAEVLATAGRNYTYTVAGGIMGVLNSEKAVSGCVNEGSITADAKYARDITVHSQYTDRDYYSYLGGVAGKAETNTSKFVSCTNKGGLSFLNSKGNVDNQKYLYQGGIVGCSENLKIENCSNRFNFIDNVSPLYRTFYVGGLSGYSENSEFNYCSNYGNIKIGLDYCGGIAAYIVGSVSANYCENYGDLSNFPGRGGYFSGIVCFVTEKVDIRYCKNYADITITSLINGSGQSAYVGGITASVRGNGNIFNSVNIGNLFVDIDDVGSYTNSGAVAGICPSDAVLLKECYNIADVNLYTKAYKDDYYGGTTRATIYGLGGGSADKCYNIGNVYISTGVATSNAISNATENANTDNYFVGSITCANYPLEEKTNFGDVDYVSDDTFSNTPADYPKKLSDLQLQEEDNFASWDFNNTWIIDPIVNSGYPILRCFYDDFMLSETKVVLKPGEQIQLAAYDNHNSTSVIRYESSNKNSAVVSSNGQITAIANGKTVISAFLADGRRANCHVYVKGESPYFTISDLTINKGNTKYIAPQNIEGEDIIKWECSDSNIIELNTVNNICTHIRALNTGSATVTATSTYGHTYTCTVTVTAIAESIGLGSATIAKGEQKQLSYTVYPSPTQSKVYFSSSDENVLTIDNNGMMTGISCGTVIITATTDNGVSATRQVTVNAPTKKLALEKTTITVIQGFTDKIVPITDPVDTTDTISFSSSNTSYVTVDSNTGVITAKKPGTVTITAKSTSGQKAYCIVTVIPVEYPVSGVSLDQSEVTLNPGEVTTLSATVHPSNATYKNVKWSVDNTDIVSVSQTGVVKALSAGEAIVRATTSDGGYTVECKVNVIIDVEGVALSRSRIAMNAGETLALTARTLPESATNKNVTWSSDNENIASVDDNGVITANAIGKTIVSVESEDGNFVAECFVNVATDTYEVIWEVNDWTLTEKYAYGEEIVQPEIAKNQGYHFVGWSVDVPKTMPAENMTFVALFEKHQPILFGEDKAPSCKETGSQKGEKCSVCDEILKDIAVLDKLSHKYESKITKASTCTATGIKTFTCSCGDTYTETIAKLGHMYSSSYTTDKKATCSTEGSKSKHCTRSGCTAKASVTVIAKLAHSYDNACDKECNVCKTTRSITHSYKVTTTKATLSKNGKVVNKCSVCGYVSKTTTVYYPKTIKLSATSYTYNGKAKTPTITVKDSKGNTLKKDTDYTVSFASGRKNTGKYSVTVAFKGKYSGKKVLYFNILPSKTSKITPTCVTTSIKASWKKVTGASGYKVELLNSKGKVVKSATTTKTAYTFKSLSKVTTYKVRVTAYKTIDSKKVYSTSYTTITTSTAPAKVTLSKVSAGSKSATPTWKKVSGASGYEVMYSTSSKFSSSKTATVSKGSSTKTTIKKLTKGKKYYFKVRAYKTVDGKKIYSAWNAVKSVKVK